MHVVSRILLPANAEHHPDHLVHRHGHGGTDGVWTLDVPLTNIELASIAGMKPRTAEKGFRELRDARAVLTRARRVIVFPELERLRHLTAGHYDLAVAAR